MRTENPCAACPNTRDGHAWHPPATALCALGLLVPALLMITACTRQATETGEPAALIERFVLLDEGLTNLPLSWNEATVEPVPGTGLRIRPEAGATDVHLNFRAGFEAEPDVTLMVHARGSTDLLIEVFWSGEGSGCPVFSQECNLRTGQPNKDGRWTLDIAEHPRWKGSIEQFRIDLNTSSDRMLELSSIRFFGRAPETLNEATASGEAPEELSDIILISLDTLRRDAVGVYDDSRPTATPSLDQFANDAVLFSTAYVPMPHTLTSHMSMLTGVYPDVHQVTSRKARLPRAITTLSEALSSAGYQTAGLVTCDWLNGEFGFSRGFESYRTVPAGLTYADRVTRSALQLVDAFSSEQRPSFLFLHYYDAHSDWHQATGNTLPYFSPASYRSDLPADRDFCDTDGRCATEFLLAAQQQKRPLEAAELDLLHELYLRGVRYLDDELGVLLDGLKERGVYDSALIIVVSDHGEEFREHDRLLHTQPYDESIAVPFLVKLPQGRHAGTRVEGVVHVLDIFPTVLDLIGVAPPGYLQGASLVPAMEHGRIEAERFILAQDVLQHRTEALCTGEHKLIRSLSGGEAELFDLRADPLERTNLSEQQQTRVDDLSRQLALLNQSSRMLAQSLADAEGSNEADVLSEEEEDRLKALGYLN